MYVPSTQLKKNKLFRFPFKVAKIEFYQLKQRYNVECIEQVCVDCSCIPVIIINLCSRRGAPDTRRRGGLLIIKIQFNTAPGIRADANKYRV